MDDLITMNKKELLKNIERKKKEELLKEIELNKKAESLTTDPIKIAALLKRREALYDAYESLHTRELEEAYERAAMHK